MCGRKIEQGENAVKNKSRASAVIPCESLADFLRQYRVATRSFLKNDILNV